MTGERVADLALGHLRVGEACAGVPVSPLGVEYGPPAGCMPLRDAVAGWQRVGPDEVAITTGASLALLASMCSLPRPASILVPRPHYPAYVSMANAMGTRAIPYDLDRARGWQPSLENIAGAIRADTRALILNQPNNPTGSIAPESLLRNLETLVRAAGILVVSDETYGELVFDGASIPDVRAIFGATSVVRVLSFSKLFGMAGERLGCVIADPARIGALTSAHWTLAMSAPATAQVIALSALRANPAGHVRALVAALERNRECAIDVLSDLHELTCIAPAGGCFLWIEVAGSPLDSRSLAQRCATVGGVKVMPGDAFGVQRPACLRASFAVPRDELTEGLRRVSRVVRDLDRRSRRPELAASPATSP